MYTDKGSHSYCPWMKSIIKTWCGAFVRGAREKQTDRMKQTDRQRKRDREKEKERQRERERETEKERQTGTVKATDKET